LVWQGFGVDVHPHRNILTCGADMTLEELSCKIHCQEAVVHFFGALDRREKDLWASTLTDDAKQHSPRHPDGFITMKDHWDRVMAKGDFFPTHILSNIAVTQTGPDTAEATVHSTAWNTYGNADDTLPRKMLDMPSRIGRMIVKFRKTESGWRISDFIGHATYLDCGRT
jgi:hypothetical protein